MMLNGLSPWKKGLLTAGFIALLLSSGCWSRRELNDLAIVLGTGIDQGTQGQVKVSVQIVKPAELKAGAGGGTGGGGGPGKPALVLSSQGATVFDAIRNFISITSRKLFFSHNEVLILGEGLARQGIGPALDFFERDPELREEAFILVARGEARKILDAPGLMERVSAQAFHDTLEAAVFMSKAVKVDLHQFLLAYNNKTTASVAPRIELARKDGQEGFRIAGMGVFKKDKLVGWLNERETRGLLWALGKVRSGIVVVEESKSRYGKISLEIIQARSKIKAGFSGGRPTVSVAVEAEANIGEETGPIDLTKPRKLKEIEKKQGEVIRKEIQAALVKAQKVYRTDIFGFGEELHRADPKAWAMIQDRWEEEFPDLPVQVTVKTKIRHIGEKIKPSVPK